MIINIFLKLLSIKRVRLFVVELLYLFYTLQIPENDIEKFDINLSKKVDCAIALKEYEYEN